ncbi:MAG: hypothetical protein RDV48_20085 [Candidatus Eremiobacteraeota bacterium]|nr:hypothetical protein [Candidatus Eremiobacteraeota bacterium]
MKKNMAQAFFCFCMMLVVTASAPCAQGEKGGANVAPRPALIEISMEILNISRFDMAAGKYNVEFGVVVRYPYIDIPEEIDIDTFKEKILRRITRKELKELLLKWYRPDEKKCSYVLNDALPVDDQIKISALLNKAGYYEGLLPFEIVNGKVETDEKQGKAKIERRELDPESPGLIYYIVDAEITSSLNFRDFPFDSQDLSIVLASKYLVTEAVFKPLENYVMLPAQIPRELFEKEIADRLKPKEKEVLSEAYRLNAEKTSYELRDLSDEKERNVKNILNSIGFNTLISSRVILPGWKIKEGIPVIGRDSYMGDKFSTFTFPMTIERSPVASFIKIFMPLVIIMLISFLSLFLGSTVLSSRLTIVSGMLLACVMAHINSTSSIPPLGNHLNLTDKIFISSYVSIFLTVLFTVLMINQHEKENEEAVRKTYVAALWCVPAATMIAYALVLSKVL